MDEVSGGMLAAKKSGAKSAGMRRLVKSFFRNLSQIFPTERGDSKMPSSVYPAFRTSCGICKVGKEDSLALV